MAKDFPSVEEDPVKFKAELALVIRSYDPNWQDLDLLLRVILPDDKRKKILEKAGWPSEPISGDPDLAANKEALTRARNGLLDSILQVFPKLPNWVKISTCKQEENESPGAYLERLTKVFERHSGIENPATTAKQALGATFVTGLDPAIQTLLKQITIGWETKPLEELLTVADHCRQCIKAKQDKEPKLMVLQSLPTKTGRDLLCRLRCTIFCTPDGVYLEVPAQTRQEVEDLLQGPNTVLVPLIPDADLLSQVPNCLWATTPNEVGRISVDPVYISVDKTKRLPRITQYPLNPAAEAGIQPVISDLLAQGVLVRCTSECNTPILPLKKPGRDTYRFVQDLRAINAIVISQFPVVPNPTTILSSIPPDSTHFTVVDLSSAFFSVPLHPDCQYLTAFTYKGQQYCWTVLPQGFRDSPTHFSQILRQDLSDITFLSGSTLIQYVDDLLLCSASLEACRSDSVVLLTALANKGHKVSKQKLQLCKPTVRYLGHDLSAGSRHRSADRIQAILSAPKPTTPSQVRSFLGMAGYCRQWIPNFSQLAKPLQELTRNATPSPIPWRSQQDTAFSSLKQTLASAPALGLPDYSRHFTLFCHEKEGCALGVLVQKHGDKYRPLAYYSTYLDPVAASFPPCLCAIAAAARILEQAEPLVLQSPLTLAVAHSVSALLLKGKTQHLSNARLVKYERLLFASPNVSVIRCDSLNPATLLPAPHEGEPHDCLQVVQAVTSPRPDLFEMPLDNPDFILWQN
ncbi:uncharacterized protein LOC142818410 [Pelodiscus sinensis]|uniref:uncharacterized protein LOC142818410 n=1 Tax=Pelodiscus sinensis TaxID=13735 RepID=UPI003F6BBA75